MLDLGGSPAFVFYHSAYHPFCNGQEIGDRHVYPMAVTSNLTITPIITFVGFESALEDFAGPAGLQNESTGIRYIVVLLACWLVGNTHALEQ